MDRTFFVAASQVKGGTGRCGDMALLLLHTSSCVTWNYNSLSASSFVLKNVNRSLREADIEQRATNCTIIGSSSELDALSN
jgi:hypothetical protein